MKFLYLVLGLAVLCMASGCASVNATAPFASSQINLNMDRDDYVVLSNAKATSTKKNLLFGIFQIVDGNKVRIFGIKFFEDQYSRVGGRNGISGLGISPLDRAYYKAMASVPEADTLTNTRSSTQVTGFPILFKETTVTLTGKAIKYKED